MYFRIRDLKECMQAYSQILVYGIGNYAAVIYPKLCEMGWEDKIECFVVTEAKQQESFFDKQVRQADEINKSGENRCVLVAVNSAIEEEIVAVIKKYKLGDYVLLSEYLIDSDDFRVLEKMYRGKEFFQYIEYMATAYEYQHVDEMLKRSRAEIVDEIRKNISDREKDEKQIVVVTAYFQTRYQYIFKSMADRGYRVTIVNYCAYIPEWTKGIWERFESVQCFSVENLLYKSLLFDPLAYYVLPVWSDASIAAIMIQQKQHFGKVVLELYDVMNGSYNVEHKLLNVERYALENADGVVWRYFAKEYLEREFGFHYYGKSLQFIDCCRGDGLKKCGENNEILKLCMAFGSSEGLCGTKNDCHRYTGDPVRYATAQEIMHNITDRKDVLVHAYIGYATEEEKAVLKEVEEQYLNFKAYYNIRYEELKEKLADYDYGIVNIVGKDILTDDNYRQDGCIRLRGTYIVAMAQKCFDYIDAGMAVISVMPKMLSNYLETYGALVRMDADQLDVEYLKQHKREYRRNAEKARIALSIENHIDELLTFFNEL